MAEKILRNWKTKYNRKLSNIQFVLRFVGRKTFGMTEIHWIHDLLKSTCFMPEVEEQATSSDVE